MGQRVLPDLKLDNTWKIRVIAAPKCQDPEVSDQERGQQDRLG